MEPGLPTTQSHLLGESGPTNGFGQRLWCCCRKGLEAVKKWAQFGKLTEEKVPGYIQIGCTVEVTEDGGHSYMIGRIADVRICDNKVIVKPNAYQSDSSNISVEQEWVRPKSNSLCYDYNAGPAPQDSFRMYETVYVWIPEKWMVGVIVHVPSANSDTYRVRLFRGKDELTVSVRSKMRLHMEWDSVTHSWTNGISELQLKRLRSLRQSVGLVGGKRARILQLFDHNHALVEYIDLKNLNGTSAKELINLENWHKGLLESIWKELIGWFDKEDPIQEFDCYMPAYICLAVLGVVSPVLFTDSAQSWPDDRVTLFYSLGGISVFLCIILLTGIMAWQPKTSGQLLKWRIICVSAAVIGVVFMSIHATYGRESFVANRMKEVNSTNTL